MYEFHYDQMVKRYGQDVRLLYTDSFIYHIKTTNLYDDMADDKDAYDTSNFDSDHPLYSGVNKKVMGKFKSETGSEAPSEFIGLRSKLYSLFVNSQNKPNSKPKLTAKGIQKSYIKNHLTHATFLKVLTTEETEPAEFQSFRSHNHVLKTIKIKKTALAAYDDKRYILPDGISTLAYGHWRINANDFD